MFRARVQASVGRLLAAVVALGVVACGGDEVKYEPRPGHSGPKASLPPVPNLPQQPTKNGDQYTVWGASFTLRSRVHQKEIKGKEITIAGYVVKTNLPDAPACAVHKGGKADPEGCQAPIPTFWLGDTKDADLKDTIRVVGWASNFAQLYDAIEHYHKNRKKEKVEPKTDTFLAIEIPNPIPVKGMKVAVTGKFGTTASAGSQGTVADPIMGVLGYQKMQVVENVEEVAILPGMKLR